MASDRSLHGPPVRAAAGKSAVHCVFTPPKVLRLLFPTSVYVSRRFSLSLVVGSLAVICVDVVLYCLSFRGFGCLNLMTDVFDHF